jgi:serine protease Do
MRCGPVNEVKNEGFPMKRIVIKPLVLSTLAIGGTAWLAGTSLALSSPNQKQNDSKTPSLNLSLDTTPVRGDEALKASFAPIVQKVAPSVVKIFVSLSTPERSLSSPDLDSFFHHFFGDRGLGSIAPGQPGSALEHALGSGVIVSPDGYILTNNHVVKSAKEIQVALNDGRTFTAKVIGTDSRTDVALIKVKADNLPALTLADSDKVNVGDAVLAIGNPFGIGQTVTSGIVSAKHRVTAGDTDEDFIQTDAAINPGNSGGALVDTEGRLIGINTEILSRSGGNQGIGFAVPSNLCRWVMESLVKYGHVTRGFLGVEIQDLNPGLAKAFNLKNAQGALVANVNPGSAGAAAGLKSGDVIVQFNGQSIQNASQLKLLVAQTGPGIPVPVEVMRNGEKSTFHVTLKELPNIEMASANLPNSQNSTSRDALHGVAVANLGSQSRAEMRLPDYVHGALVTEVDPASPAYDAGLRSGDVILEIDHHTVKDAQDAVKDTAKPMGHETLVRIWSQGSIRYISVPESVS